MANIETGFIPEQGVTYQGGAPRSTIATVFSVLATIIAILGTVGVWWLDRKEEVKVQSLKSQLAGMEEKINFAEISKLSQLDKRINVARDMLTNHAMPSVMLKYLADNTVSSVKWKQFSYSRGVVAAKTGGAADAANSPGDTIALSGETAPGSGYGPLYQQVTRFRDQKDVIQSVELLSFQIDQRTGVVTMQIKLVIKPTFATFGGLRTRSAPVDSKPAPDARGTGNASTTPATPSTQTLTPDANVSAPKSSGTASGTIATPPPKLPTASTSSKPASKPPITQ